MGRGKEINSEPRTPSPHPKLRVLTRSLLRRWPLPQPDEDGDKEERGRVLVVGGATEMPGAVMLAATAALRAGAGKLQIATCRSIAQLVAAAIPEARVFSLPETKSGAIAASAAGQVVELAQGVHALLIGPGLIDERAMTGLLEKTLPRLDDHATLVLDAGALSVLSKDQGSLSHLRGNVVLTPHAGEMAKMLNDEKDAIVSRRREVAERAAEAFQAVVALKGAETFIASPAAEIYCNRSGNIGLATSGSGDTLSGIIAGLAARGATPTQAAAWGVYLHACAGDQLAKRMGQLGFLARELLDEIPALMAKFDESKSESKGKA